MPPFRIVVRTDEGKTTRTVITELDRTPDVGETIKLPHGQRVIVREVDRSYEDMLGLVALRSDLTDPRNHSCRARRGTPRRLEDSFPSTGIIAAGICRPRGPQGGHRPRCVAALKTKNPPERAFLGRGAEIRTRDL